MSWRRMAAVIGCVLAMAVHAAAAQAGGSAQAPQGGGLEAEILRYAVTQGGLLIVIILLLWRDREAREQLLAREQKILDALTAVTVATTQRSERADAETEAIDKFREVVERCKNLQPRA